MVLLNSQTLRFESHLLKSLMARLWRWHTNWCPGWKAYQKALADDLSEKEGTLSLLCQRIAEIPAQQALFLLKNCLAVPKLLYLLRTSPSFLHPSKLAAINETLRDSLESVLNVSLDGPTWSQVTLSTKMGVLGIPLPSDLAPAAFISSWLSCHTLTATIVGATPPPNLLM